MAAGNRHFPFGSRGSMVSGKHSYTATSGRRFSSLAFRMAIHSSLVGLVYMRLAVWHIGPQHPRALGGGRTGEGEQAERGDQHAGGDEGDHRSGLLLVNPSPAPAFNGRPYRLPFLRRHFLVVP